MTRRQTLSVICPTHHPGPLVAACLAPLADVADEIIIAADDRVGADDLAEYATVATELVRFKFTGEDRHWPWLASRADGDWLLVLDGDETPSAELLELIPAQLERREIRECSVPVRWLFGDPTTFVTSQPIALDRRYLLQRNDPYLAFGAQTHSVEIPHGPTAHLDAAMYHVGLLLMSRAEREAKVAAYEALRPGLVTELGGPLNPGLYLPEDHGLQLSDVPDADADRLRATLAATGSGAPPIVVESLVHAAAEEIDRVRGGGDSRPMTLAARSGPPEPLLVGRPAVRWWVDVTNGSEVTWPGGATREPLVRVGVRWLDESGAVVGDARAELPHALRPGQMTLVPVTLVPPQSGRLTVELDGVQEHVRWFDQPLRYEVDVG